MKLRSKAIWVLLGDGGAKLFGLFSTLYLARVFGVNDYGQITYALSILGVAGIFTDMGLHTLGTRSRAVQFSDGTGRPSDLFWLRILLSVVVLALFVPILWIMLSDEPELRTLTLLFLLSVVPQSLQTEWHYRGTQRFRWYSLSRWVQSLVYLGGLILLIQTQDLLWVPIIFSLSIFVSVLVQWGGYKPLGELFQRPEPMQWKRLLKAGALLTAGGFLFQTVTLLPPLLMEFSFSFYEIGLYGAMFKVILAAMIADRVFTTLLLPTLAIRMQGHRHDGGAGQPSPELSPDAILGKDSDFSYSISNGISNSTSNSSNNSASNGNGAGPERAPKHRETTPLLPEIRRIVLWMLFFGLSGALLLILFAPQAILLLYGDAYIEGVRALQILSLFLPATFVNSVFMFGLIAGGHDESYLRAGMMGGAASLGWMLFGTLSGSFTLFLMAVPLAEGTIAWSVYRAFRKVVPAAFPRHAFGMLIAFTLAAVASVYAAPAGWSIVLILPGFAVLTWLTGGIRKDDLTWLWRRLT